MIDITIFAMRAISSVFFLVAFILALRIHSKVKKTTKIWAFFSLAFFVLFLESGANAIEWTRADSLTIDLIGEYLTIAFSLIWIFVSHKFNDILNSLSKK